MFVKPDSFEAEKHYYPRVLNSQIHPLVSYFLRLGNKRIAERYCHLNPKVNREALEEILKYQAKYFRWAGADLFHVTSDKGNREMVVIEINSCPSGQKSMPQREEGVEEGGYKMLIEQTFKPLVDDYASRGKLIADGGLAVIYDKNDMEASGYAAAMADAFDENVWLVESLETTHATRPNIRYNEDDVLEIRDAEGNWHKIRACFRYLTQRPWTRLRLTKSKTLVLNPIISCLSGGRNKMIAAKAYDFYNAEIAESGLSIRTPQTYRDVSKAEIPLWVRTLGGKAVIKVPYANAGQGVFTITSEKELKDFMASNFKYELFIVQSLIGNSSWSSKTHTSGQLYHVGTIPARNGAIYVADLRMMVSATKEGWHPLAIYARRAREPLAQTLTPGMDSWEQLGTNLSVKLEDGSFTTEPNRLLIMDRKDFNILGIGIDDLIDSYIQTVLSTVAVDRLCCKLMENSNFDKELFSSLNNDKQLLDEITY